MKNEIGSMIKNARINKNMTQSDLAKKLGHKTPQFVSFIERGISKTPLETIGRLVKMIGIDKNKIIKILEAEFKENLIKEITKGEKTK